MISAAQLASMQSTTVASFDKSGIRRRLPLVTDRYNDPTPNRGAPDDMPIPKLSLRQMSGSELRTDREAQIGEWIGRVPIDTDITGRDQLLADGITFEVIGPPEDLLTHLHLRLRVIEG